MGLFSEDYSNVDPDLIPWNTKDAAFLPFYLFGAAFAVFIMIPHVISGQLMLAFLPLIAGAWLVWKSLRAIEAHRNLKRLKRLYEEMQSKL